MKARRSAGQEQGEAGRSLRGCDDGVGHVVDDGVESDRHDREGETRGRGRARSALLEIAVDLNDIQEKEDVGARRRTRSVPVVASLRTSISLSRPFVMSRIPQHLILNSEQEGASLLPTAVASPGWAGLPLSLSDADMPVPPFPRLDGRGPHPAQAQQRRSPPPPSDPADLATPRFLGGPFSGGRRLRCHHAEYRRRRRPAQGRAGLDFVQRPAARGRTRSQEGRHRRADGGEDEGKV